MTDIFDPIHVVLDEAYVEFADHPSRASRVLDRDNLVVLRTFSKAAGIAGLGLGYRPPGAYRCAHRCPAGGGRMTNTAGLAGDKEARRLA